MAQLHCPLCKQEVSRLLYEKITGVWQEKQKALAALKKKEKALAGKEERLRKRFESEKKKIIGGEKAKLKKELAIQQKAFKAEIQKEKAEVRKKRAALKKKFTTDLATAVSRMKRQEQTAQKKLETSLKQKFKISAKNELKKKIKKVGKDRLALERKEKIQRNKANRLTIQIRTHQSNSAKALAISERKITSLEEQVRKNRTAQVLGLLEEKRFLEELKQLFEGDKFKHTGKGGDILHYIMAEGQQVGTIVYELKKVSHFSKAHIDQTLKAKKTRDADYGILVTNAKRSKDKFGFGVEKGVIIIHPAGSLVLIRLLRDHIIRISKLRLSAKKRNKTVQAVLEYIQSQSFRNGIESIIQNTKELYGSLEIEVKDHLKIWDKRLEKYRDIYISAYEIDGRAVKLLAEDNKPRITAVVDVTAPIALPKQID